MKAEIYCFDNQDSEIMYLMRVLRRCIYPALAIERHVFSPNSRWDSVQNVAPRLMKLMQAAIPPRVSLRLYAKRRVESGLLYLELYSTAFPRGYPFKDGDMQLFFPAVALHDRMFMVSKNLDKALQDFTKAQSTFRSLADAGVLVVDFADDGDVAKAAEECSRQIRNDVMEELAAYASYENKWDLVNMARAAKSMKVDRGYLLHCLQAGAVDRALYNSVSCSLSNEEVALKTWTKVRLVLANKSPEPVSGAEVTLAGPVEVRPDRLYVDIPGMSKTELTLSVKSMELGDVPIEIRIATRVDKVFSAWLPVHHVWLHTAAAAKQGKAAAGE